MNVTKLFATAGRWSAGLGLAVGLMSTACNHDGGFSETPEIAPLRVTQTDVSAPGNIKLSLVTVVISWKDGDGDLGALPDDTNPSNVNYFITIEKRKMIGGQPQFVAITPSSTSSTGFNGKFKNLNPEGETSTKSFKLRGELAYQVYSPGFTVVPPEVIGTINGVNETVRKGDVLRFQVQIKDRAGHLSNKITTQEVTL